MGRVGRMGIWGPRNCLLVNIQNIFVLLASATTYKIEVFEKA